MNFGRSRKCASASVSNPKNRGRPSGSKNKKTLEKEKEEILRLEKDKQEERGRLGKDKKDDFILKLRKSLADLENYN